MLRFLNKSSVVKNFDLSSVLPVDPVTYIMTTITFCLVKICIYCQGSLKLRVSCLMQSEAEDPHAEIYLAIVWMQKDGLYASCECHDIVLKRTSKSVTLGMPNPNGFTIGMPDLPSRTSKNWEWNISPARDLGPKLSYNLGENKMEQQTPIPPNQGWRRAKGKDAPFSHPWFGEGGGSRFSIYFVQDCRSVLGCKGMNSIFPCLWDVISKYQWSL